MALEKRKVKEIFTVRIKIKMKEGVFVIILEQNNNIECIEKAIIKAKDEIKKLPEGKLKCTKSNGSNQYYINGKYTSKNNMRLIQGVAQREYLEKVVPLLEKTLKKMIILQETLEINSIEKYYESLCSARKELVVPLFNTTENIIKQHMQAEYEPGEFDEDNQTEFFSMNGERLRSKSELIIADELYKYNVPYRYEMPLILNDRGREITIRPDFTIINRSNGKKYIYEHLGMMDNPDYVEKNMRKLDLYEKNGFLLGKNLIITRETSDVPLIISVVKKYIENYFI